MPSKIGFNLSTPYKEVSFVERGDRSEEIGGGCVGLFFWVGVGFVVTYKG
jgi:hypothetical protein